MSTTTDDKIGLQAINYEVDGVKFTVAMQKIAGQELVALTYWVNGRPMGRPDYEAIPATVTAGRQLDRR
jgi:hypothetical protein